MATTLTEGQPAPDFTVETDKGETVSLTDFAGIVLRRSDAVHLTTLPGLLTDFHLDRLDT